MGLQRWWPKGAAVRHLLMGAGAALLLAGISGAAVGASATPNPVIQGWLSWQAAHCPKNQAGIWVGNGSFDTSPCLVGADGQKLSPLQVDQEQQELAQSLPRAPKPAPLPPPPAISPSPLPPRVPGGIGRGIAPVPGAEFEAANGWDGMPIGGAWLQAWAGSKAPFEGHPSPAVLLTTVPINPNLGEDVTIVGIFTAPCGGTQLTITSEQGTTLQLVGSDGTTVSFNLVTHAFTCGS